MVVVRVLVDSTRQVGRDQRRVADVLGDVAFRPAVVEIERPPAPAAQRHTRQPAELIGVPHFLEVAAVVGIVHARLDPGGPGEAPGQDRIRAVLRVAVGTVDPALIESSLILGIRADVGIDLARRLVVPVVVMVVHCKTQAPGQLTGEAQVQHGRVDFRVQRRERHGRVHVEVRIDRVGQQRLILAHLAVGQVGRQAGGTAEVHPAVGFQLDVAVVRRQRQAAERVGVLDPGGPTVAVAVCVLEGQGALVVREERGVHPDAELRTVGGIAEHRLHDVRGPVDRCGQDHGPGIAGGVAEDAAERPHAVLRFVFPVDVEHPGRAESALVTQVEPLALGVDIQADQRLVQVGEPERVAAPGSHLPLRREVPHARLQTPVRRHPVAEAVIGYRAEIETELLGALIVVVECQPPRVESQAPALETPAHRLAAVPFRAFLPCEVDQRVETLVGQPAVLAVAVGILAQVVDAQVDAAGDFRGRGFLLFLLLLPGLIFLCPARRCQHQ